MAGDTDPSGTDYFAVDTDGSGNVTLTESDSKGAIHIYSIEEVAGLETALFKGNYPAWMVLRHIEEPDIIERGAIDQTPEIGLYIDQLREFIALTCESDWPTTIDEKAVSRVKEVVCQ